jgi:hypothetical protein
MASLQFTYDGGGLNVGDVVFAKHSDPYQEITPGLRGVVQRRGYGALDVYFAHGRMAAIAPSHVDAEDTYLSSLGFRRGQRVYSTVSWAQGTKSIVPGTLGTVLGGGTGVNSTPGRMSVRFDSGVTVNVVSEHISRRGPEEDNLLGLVESRMSQMHLQMPKRAAADVGRPAPGTPAESLSTSAISLISHTHGRERRQERSIQRRELQEAIKYGRKEQAHPGRDGVRRWKYTHHDIVYVTDEFSRHEITSWRLSGSKEQEEGNNGAFGNDIGDFGATVAAGSHTVIVVDHSGSMRKDDVPGYETRTAAVYECLAKEFIQPQLDNPREMDGGSVVTLIEMSDHASVAFDRRPIDDALLQTIKDRKHSRARSHGNYLSALDAVESVLAPEISRSSHLLVVFLSDGAPSDHSAMACEHGVQVWQQDYSGGGGRANTNTKDLRKCKQSWPCRNILQKFVEDECVRRVSRLGDRFGRDRLNLYTVAFGPPSESYAVLENMAGALPRGGFQKLGLSASGLSSALTSFSSTLTTLRTDASTGSSLTKRNVEKIAPGSSSSAQAATIPSGSGATIIDPLQWDLYAWGKSDILRVPPFNQQLLDNGRELISKKVYDFYRKQWVRDDLLPGAVGVAHMKKYFAEGAERYAYRCCEVDVHGKLHGPPLVAKQTRFEEYLTTAYHDNFARTQAEAQALAKQFNDRAGGPPSWNMYFVKCYMYSLNDWGYQGSKTWILVEQELEGRYTKWNNNNGSVKRWSAAEQSVAEGGLALEHLKIPRRSELAPTRLASLGAITEGGSDEESEDEHSSGGGVGGGGDGSVGSGGDAVDEVPQCFSHFTWSVTSGKKLVCDIQGVWNATDGFTLTDPVIHYNSSNRRHVNGATDKGKAGMGNFFKSHKCCDLCRRLGLTMPSPGAFD